MDLKALEQAPANDNYLFGRGAAWFAFAMTMALMIFDYVDRQVIVSLFPYLKVEWQLSDKQLGALVSIVSITVALGALPVALFADRVSRVKSIVAMATAWSLASVSCMFTRGYGALFAARAVVGVGEAGYGSVGSALIVSHFPARMRGALMAGFFACASVGSVLGVMLGGLIASKWGWQSAFGVVGVPGLVLALAYLKVRDYPTVALAPEMDAKRRSVTEAASHIGRLLMRAPTMLWVCIGGAAQLIVVSALWAWLPSFLNRVHGIPPAQAGVKAAVVVLCCAIGAVVWGAVADKAGARAPRRKLAVMAALCVVSMIVLVTAFAFVEDHAKQFAVIALGGFFATCTVGPVVAIALDVTHPGVRSTGASVLALFQNLFGLATGPFLAGMLSDAWGLVPALTVMPVFALVAAGAFLLAARSYEADKARAHQPLHESEVPAQASAAAA
jgi:MFS transporter, Spinster family, sphingosine-1-phosphate transporter